MIFSMLEQLSNAVLPIVRTLGGILKFLRFEQLANALPPMVSSFSGKVIVVKLLQLANELPPSEIRLVGSVTSVSEEQPLNAEPLMFCIILLILTVLSAVQFKNILSGMSIVTLSLICTFFNVAFLWNGE